MHTNSLGIFDGQNTVSEMISRAVNIGYTELGISNHLCCHPQVPSVHPMFFHDFQQASDIYKQVIDEIRTASLNFNIPVKVGFEVDFFDDARWRDDFEKLRQSLSVDYYIGACHFMQDKSADKIINFYHRGKDDVNEQNIVRCLESYWQNVIAAVKSGYFDFMAHLDVVKIFGYCLSPEWDDYKWQLIEALDEYKQPYEINTSGWNKANEQHPHTWMIEELNRRNVPVVLSDDAHSITMIAQHFERAEALLSAMNYKNRFKL